MKNYEEIFHQSFDRALKKHTYNEDFISRFYDCFFSKSEEIQQLFANTNMSSQKTMLHDSLHLLLDFYHSRKETSQLLKLGKVHSQKQRNIRPELYDMWLDSLIEAVREYDNEFDEDTELAWRLVMAPGITYIKYMYDK